METLGRLRDHLKVLPGAFVVVGESATEALEKRARLYSLVHYDSAAASLSIALGHNASGFDPDGPLSYHFLKDGSVIHRAPNDTGSAPEGARLAGRGSGSGRPKPDPTPGAGQRSE
jgi:alkanesulfonate monooxygenase SsuD/methylene tetrahydromethanopterin reductase-like flavin-dependent oxidoreductase (luciferase family)